MPEFYMIFAQKIFFPNFLGAKCRLPPRLLRLLLVEQRECHPTCMGFCCSNSQKFLLL